MRDLRWKFIGCGTAGGLYGIANQTAHYTGTAGEPFAELLGRGWAWALCGVIAALLAHRFFHRILLTMVTLTASTLAYYGTAVWWVIKTNENLVPRPWWEMFLDRASVITGWLAIAAFFAPTMALLAGWIQKPHWHRPAALLIITMMVAWDANSKRPYIHANQTSAHAMNIAICVAAVGIGALAAISLIATLWRGRSHLAPQGRPQSPRISSEKPRG